MPLTSKPYSVPLQKNLQNHFNRLLSYKEERLIDCYVFSGFHVLGQLPGEHEETSSLTLRELQLYVS